MDKNKRFFALLSFESADYDKTAARDYGLENWSELTEKNRDHWDHVFGIETRVKVIKESPRHILLAIARDEDIRDGFSDETAATL
jgi:hypothetical protein